MADWTWLGDHLAVDFANTVRESQGVMVDLIPTVEDFFGWLTHEADRLPRLTSLTTPELEDVRRLRDDVLALLHAAEAGERLPSASLSRVNDTVVSTGTTRTLVEPGRAGTAAATHDLARGVRGLLAAAAVDLLAREDLANLALCRAPGCGQFFHRARPNQRWCSPGCGNRARVDRHRHRRGAAQGAER